MNGKLRDQVTVHKQDSASVNKRQMKNNEKYAAVKGLNRKHGEIYITPQLHIWACMIASCTCDDMNDPPHVPMIISAPIPKKQKHESMTLPFVDATTVFTNSSNV